jgi:hypothetical protein
MESGVHTLASWILDRRPSSSEIEKKCIMTMPVMHPIRNWPYRDLQALYSTQLRGAVTLQVTVKRGLFPKVTTSAYINERGDTVS